MVWQRVRGGVENGVVVVCLCGVLEKGGAMGEWWRVD